MDRKKIIIIALIIIILVSCAIIINSQNSTKKSDNSYLNKNNTSENNISNDNNLLNNFSDKYTNELGKKSVYTNTSIINQNHLNLDVGDENNGYVENNDSDQFLVTAEDIKKLVEDGVIWINPITGGDEKNVQIGEPYKRDEGYWLVPAFNKNTGEFLGAVWVGADIHKNRDGSFSHGFINGIDSYSVYKDIISGKEVDSGGGDFSYDSKILKSSLEQSNNDSNGIDKELEYASDSNNSSKSICE